MLFCYSYADPKPFLIFFFAVVQVAVPPALLPYILPTAFGYEPTNAATIGGTLIPNKQYQQSQQQSPLILQPPYHHTTLYYT